MLACLGEKSLYEIGSQAGIPTSATDRGVAEVCGGKYPSWRLSLFRSTLWSVFSTVSIPACDGLLKGIPVVIVYNDDIPVTGKTEQEHLAALEEVHIHGTHCDIPRSLHRLPGGRKSSSFRMHQNLTGRLG